MKKSFFLGGLGFLSLIAVYFSAMLILSRSLKETFLQFQDLWFWIVLLSVGFGAQVGLYAEIRALIKKQTDSSKRMVITTGTTSSVSMLVCCAHHLSDVLPLLGLSAASLFLVRYQVPILIGSLSVNFLGLVVMARNLRKLKTNTDA